MKYVKKIHRILINISRGKFILLTMIMGLCISIFTHILIQLIFQPLPHPHIEKPLRSLFFRAIIVAPIFETFIYQWLLLIYPLKSFQKLTNKKILVGVFISAFLFGIVHFYSWNYILYAFFVGLYLNYIAILSVFLRKKKINIFISVLLIHLFINSFVFFVNLL